MQVSHFKKSAYVTGSSWHDSTERLAETSWRKYWLLDWREAERLPELLINYQHVLSLSEGDLGTTHVVPYRIEMDNVFPIRQQPRRTSPLKHDEFERQVTSLIQQGKVKEFVKPLVFFSCGVNSKKRQSKTVCGLSPAEYIEGKGCPLLTARWLFSFHFISGWWWYSTLDLAMGYWQVAMDADTQEKAAFALSSGFYEWNVMPFGFATHPEHLRDWWILFWRTYIW